MRIYYVSGKQMTVSVGVEDGRIVEGPPIVRRWIGQPFDRFVHWLGQGVRVVEI